MKKFAKTILIFLLFFFLAEKIFFIPMFISPKLEKDKRLEMVINGEINKEIIVLGSSRGARNIIAKQIQDSLKVSTYNLSYPGSNIEFHEFLLRSLIKFNTAPKIVLLVVDPPTELLADESITFRLDRMYPLAKYNYINNEMIKRGEKNLLSYFLALSRINKKNFNLSKKQFSQLDSIRNCGSMPLSFESENKNMKYRDVSFGYNQINELKIKKEAFYNIQKICFNNNIELHILIPPNFSSLNDEFKNRLKSIIIHDAQLETYNNTNIKYRDSSIFFDYGHLNEKGAIIYTNEIINILKKK